MLLKVVFVFSFLALGDSYDKEQIRSMLDDLSSVRKEERLVSEFDLESFKDFEEVRKVITDYGMDPDDVTHDIASILTAIPGIFKNGDEKRWATLNFAYQLACYDGVQGPFFTQALWALTRFNGYGCYCGGGNYYGNYLDATDKCCMVHDTCYDRVMAKYKLSLGCHTYTVPYSVSCCKDEKYTKCTDSGPSAGRELCECDQKMAKCVAENSRSYNYKYVNNRSKCSSGHTTKPLSALDVLKSCKHALNPTVKFQHKYGSQGSCPKSDRGGWWFGK